MKFFEGQSENLAPTLISSAQATGRQRLNFQNAKWILLLLFCTILSIYTFDFDMSFYRYHAKTNLELIQYLQKKGVLTSDRVFNVMSQVDRGNYIQHGECYVDAPQSIGYHATISAPHMHAHALEHLADKLQDGSKALDVGFGSGYLTVCMALLVGPNGSAVGIEHIPQLKEVATKNIEKDHSDLLKNGQIELIVGDGRLGHPSKAPYDAIHVGAAAPGVPDKLVSQLAPGGRMIIPIGNSGDQMLYQIDKTVDGQVIKRPLMGVIYVPLTDKENQIGRS